VDRPDAAVEAIACSHGEQAITMLLEEIAIWRSLLQKRFFMTGSR
jgi:hypothetical protein